MKRAKAISREALAELGAKRLAQLLVEARSCSVSTIRV